MIASKHLSLTFSLGRRLSFGFQVAHRKPFQRLMTHKGQKTAINSSNYVTDDENLQGAMRTFQELGLDKSLYDKAGGIRFRQHVNPLKKELQDPVKPLEWDKIFEDPFKPLILDVGSGYGRFLLGLSKIIHDSNCLGLEIREPIIQRANKWSFHLGMQNRVYFTKANATVSIASMLSTYPGPVQLVLVQYPDPHFKKKHRKRRIVQLEFVESILEVLAEDGKIFLQSDVLEVAEDMRNKFELGSKGQLTLSEEHSGSGTVFFEESKPEEGRDTRMEDTLTWKKGGWLVRNPLPVPTERECHVLEQGLPVYRVMLTRSAS